jgi:hypothetical protein
MALPFARRSRSGKKRAGVTLTQRNKPLEFTEMRRPDLILRPVAHDGGSCSRAHN